MITKKMIKEQMYSSERMRIPWDADYHTAISINSVADITPMSAHLEERYITECLTFKLSLQVSRPENDEQGNRIKSRVAGAMHEDLYGEVISKVHKAIWACEMGNTREDTLKVLTDLASDLTGR